MTSRVTRTLRHVPTLLVLAALLAIGIVGHRSGWTIPSLQSLLGGQEAPKEDWCAAHNVPDSKCLACHPELAGADPADWCKEHGVPESQCTVCHPELLTGATPKDWCKEHGVPESQCTLCHPEIAVKRDAPQDPSVPTVSEDPAAALPPEKNPATCQTHAARIQFASVEAMRKAGVGVEAVLERPMSATVRANTSIDYDRSRLAHIAPRVPGVVWRVMAEQGARVRKGDVLALIDSAQVGQTKTEFLNALASVDVRARAFERVKASSSEGFRTSAELLASEAEMREAKLRLLGAEQALANLGLPLQASELRETSETDVLRKLRLLGFSGELMQELDNAGAPANLLPLLAPLDGTVIFRDAVQGELASTERPLFDIADISSMWGMLDVKPEDLALVKLGQPVSFRPDVAAEDAVLGKVTWISSSVDEMTRTVKVRAAFDNAEGRLRAGTFGLSRITVRSEPKAVAVANEALHWEGCCHVVFVQLADDIFQPRKVKLGARNGPVTEILIGVLPGEVVATRGSHVLKSALLKSRLGAGCVDD